MTNPLTVFQEWQTRQTAGDFEHLEEVVDLMGFRDICVGLSDWTTGYQAAFENLNRNMLTPLADWKTMIEDIVEGPDEVVVRMRCEATHVADFLGIPATGRRVHWEAVGMVKVKDGKVVQNYTMLDLWGIYRQLTEPQPEEGRRIK